MDDVAGVRPAGPKLFTRQASGLVREVSVTNALFFNTAAFVGTGVAWAPVFYTLAFVPIGVAGFEFEPEIPLSAPDPGASPATRPPTRGPERQPPKPRGPRRSHPRSIPPPLDPCDMRRPHWTWTSVGISSAIGLPASAGRRACPRPPGDCCSGGTTWSNRTHRPTPSRRDTPSR